LTKADSTTVTVTRFCCCGSVSGFVEESAFLGEYHTVDQTGQSGMPRYAVFLSVVIYAGASDLDVQKVLLRDIWHWNWQTVSSGHLIYGCWI